MPDSSDQDPSSSPSSPGDQPSRTWLRRLVAYCWRYRSVTILAVGGAVTASVLTAMTPLVVKGAIDGGVLTDTSSLAFWLGLMVVLATARGAVAFVRRYYAGMLRDSVGLSLRQDLFGALQRLDGRQQDKLQTGQVVSRATSDISMVERLVDGAPLLLGSQLQFLVSMVVMFILSPPLTIVTLVLAPTLFLVARHGSKVFFPSTWEQSQRRGEVAGVVEAAVTGVRVVKGFGQERAEQARLEEAATTLFRAGMRVNRLVMLFMPIFRSIPAIGQVGVLAFGGWLALNGNITIGTFLAFATYLAQMMGPMMMLAGQLTMMQTTKAAAVRIFEVTDARPVLTDPADPQPVPEGAATIELDGVTFGYDDDHPVLREVSLRVAPGETLALVGGAGSGKSTVTQLLARFYDPQAGAIRLGGRDLRGFSMGALRSRIGMVFEDSFLFSDTVAANIAFGRPDATEAEVVAAAKAAEADRFIAELADGYDTMVGERGLTLSGGQRQRIALARAILTDPQVLVLDDATSAVDAGVEAEIHATLRRVMAGRTTLLIAHRASTLHLADRIAVLHYGEVVDVGTHDELIARCARYRLLLTGHDDGLTRELDELGESANGNGAVAIGAGSGPLWENPPEEAATGTGALGTVGLPPDQAAKVAMLPPATDEPAIDLDMARAPEPAFRLRRLWQPFRRALLLGAGLFIADALVMLALPWLTRAGIDEGVQRGDPGTLFALSALAACLVGVGFLVSRTQTRVIGRTGERLLFWLRVKLSAHLQRLGLDFYERERDGQIMTRMTTDIDSVTAFIQGSLGQLIIAGMSFFGVLGVMLVLNAQLTVAVLALLPAFVVAVWIFRRYSSRAYEAAREQLSTVNADFQENVSGIRVAQAYGREPRNIENFGELTGEYYRRQLRAQRIHAVFFSFIEFATEAAAVIVLGVGAGLVAGGNLSVGGIIAFMLYLNMLFSPVQQFSQVLDGYQRAKVGMRRIAELLRTATSTPDPADPIRVGRLSGEVGFDDVHFSYRTWSEDENGEDNGRVEVVEALAGVSVGIEPGETVAIVGETGAGKSTMVKLVARFYDPTTGAVRVGGTDLRKLDLPGYRTRIGIVPQEAYLFNGSVRDAIAYGRPDADNAEIERAARAVGAHEMIATLRHGYLHPVGERGRGLSAGQRQLLALARAQLVDPDILLLDEATASLDLATEAAVTGATERLASKRTTLVIAHRLTTAERADRILVVDGGRIVEAGPHDELVAAGGRYAELWHAFTGD